MMLERPGEVVTREELQKGLWPHGTFVDFDHSLNNAINKIREVLGDSAESPRFVETLARRGYRFIAAVEGISNVAAPSQPQAPSPWAKRSISNGCYPITAFAQRTWVWLGATLVVLAMAV
jgi:DNA-binding winged helix-turn-helix (wHTH) protein